MKFNAEEWFSKYQPHLAPGSIAFNRNLLQPILDFTLLWNLFESVICGRCCTLHSIKQHVRDAVNQGRIGAATFSIHLEFMRWWYTSYRGKEKRDDFWRVFTNTRRGQAKKDEADAFSTLEKVILDGDNDVESGAFALIFIAYRIRNNLFHGEKGVFTLYQQTDLFQSINGVIALYIDISEHGKPTTICFSNQ